jgi:hypothetical protein
VRSNSSTSSARARIPLTFQVVNFSIIHQHNNDDELHPFRVQLAHDASVTTELVGPLGASTRLMD